MKKVLILSVMFVIATECNAANFYQSNNPFPQTSIQNFNNIYESEPDVIQTERKKAKKSWFRRNTSSEIQEKTIINQDENNGSFYVFPAE